MILTTERERIIQAIYRRTADLLQEDSSKWLYETFHEEKPENLDRIKQDVVEFLDKRGGR